MDDLSDDNLKRNFGRLSAYESKENGIEWSVLEKSVNVSKTDRISRYALLVACVMLLLVPASVEESEKSKAQTETAPITRAFDDSKVECNGISNESSIAQSNSMQVNSKTIAIQTIEIEHSIHDGTEKFKAISLLRDAPPFPFDASINEVIPSRFNVQPENEIVSIPETDHNSASESDTLKKKMEIRIGALYQFGVVDPISSDNKVLNKYRSMPGVGFSAELAIPSSLFQKPVDFVLSYSVIHKKTEYTFLEYGPESLTNEANEISPISMVISAGVSLPFRSTWNIIPRANYTFGDISAHTGKASISLTLQKNFVLGDFDLYSGVTGAAPLTGTIRDFKYFPISIHLGYRMR